jgi:hypothetical protein
LSISDCQFIDCGDTNADDALDYEGNANADQLTGTATLTNCTIADTFGEALVIENFATGTLDLTLENVMISAATGDAFATLVEQGTLNVSANNCTISNIQGAGIAFGLGTNATGTYIVTAADINSIGEAAVELESLGTATLTVTGTAAATITNCQDGILVIADGASTTVNLQDITINAVDVGIVFEHISGIFNSTIDTQTLANNSISGGGDAIEVTSGAGAGVDTSPRIQISNSQFASTNADGGSFKIDNTTSNNSVFHLTMDNNSFTGAVGCSLEMANASVFCANLTNNTFTGTTSDLALLNTNTNATQDSFLLDGFAGDGTDSAQVTTFLTATQNNTLTNNTIDFGGVVNFGRGTCLLPSP